MIPADLLCFYDTRCECAASNPISVYNIRRWVVLVQPLELDLQHLQKEVWALGLIVERAIVESVDVLQQRPLGGSQPLIILDHQITQKRLAIELDCINLIAAQHAPGDDLRTIAAMLEIATELGRIGDYITDIAKIHFMLVRVEAPLLELFGDICLMATKTQSMLQRALEALQRQDLALARCVFVEDDEVDALYDHVYLGLLASMGGRSRTVIKKMRYLSQIARNLERAADRVTNICEWIAFSLTGELALVGDEKIYQEDFV